jgi:hypothetical protein
VRTLLGDRVTDVRAELGTLRVDRFSEPDAFREYFKRNYGPAVATYHALATRPERSAALDADLDALAASYDQGDGAMDWEYLLLTASVLPR